MASIQVAVKIFKIRFINKHHEDLINDRFKHFS